ncbi:MULTISPECIES: DpnI domain-containing protein [unclassified Sulfurimonas]|jgi:type II restriction enzyme|uniref:DpnI domain-containing protein n=1 Tax=unclassified Sulfurimonas TaxID=2623549 RepID=UPI0008CB2FB3|nr:MULTISPECIES: DpnI domain-containing protein [unclassified Sulfurimonas]OHE12141.1 MAG: restriction endonuclease [Sulfurimonas sp. RIFOXYC2_FULL_36_7]MBS4066979.1 restriction endonuclease [Sulfurimonas sp.]MDD3854744.1 DpnI domain-containing protein [Sulfurimonas sp.]MDX9756163.1 DpnI domain-containing protein [Sulfurimonas sp.]OHE06369.1 MAG: restriction endonuclease [Sulfurimonas sp. RIFOXYB12_FULL_35_9]
MSLNLYSSISDSYNSNSQKIRVLTENWVNEYIYCPSCGQNVSEYKNNKPVADFYCAACNEDYELKSKKDKMGKKIVDGAYSTMIERLQSDSNPNFFFLNYDKNSFDVTNFLVIPKHFFIPQMIEKRKPLSSTARRAGWIGCNILLDTIPASGKIFYIKDGEKQSKDKILEDWNKTSFLKWSHDLNSKSWLLDVLTCIEKLNKQNFNLNELYQFENYLRLKHPDNNNIQAKIRQQLQLLRDKNYLKFESRGKYKLYL